MENTDGSHKLHTSGGTGCPGLDSVNVGRCPGLDSVNVGRCLVVDSVNGGRFL